MTMPAFSHQGRTLRITSAEALTEALFDWPIAQVIPIGAAAVVRTEPTPGSGDNRNVFAVNAYGLVTWRVPERKHVYEDSPYTHIEFRDGRLKLSNWDGLNLDLEPFTWRELHSDYGR